MIVNLGSGTHYANGWLNLDVRSDHHTKADQIVDGNDPLAGFTDDSVERVYLGHLLEHVPWPRVVPLLVDVRRVLQPHGQALSVGPDVYRLLRLWKKGMVGWESITGTIEHQDHASAEWPEAVHHWNAHEQRVLAAFADAQFPAIRSVDDAMPLAGWPIVGWDKSWQCAVLGVEA